MVIWKFSLMVIDRQTITMPVNAEILSVQMQAGVLCMWAVVDPDAEREQRLFEILGTGHAVPDVGKDVARHHLATVQARGGELVWHVFELM